MPRKIEVHGHRGSRGTLPENCIPSFQEAADCGADFLELDLQLSSDDVPMVFHDPLISSKLCQKKGKTVTTPIALRSLTAAQIKEYDCGSLPQKSFPEQKQVAHTFICSFEDVLQWAATKATGIGLNIELKQEATPGYPAPDPERYATLVVDLLRRYQLMKRARLQCFDFAPLRFVRKIDPQVTMACLFEEKRDFCSETLATGAQIVAPFYEFVTPELLRECHSKGLRVIPWTVNDPAWWEKLVGWGIDGIITDYPRKLVAEMSGFASPRRGRGNLV